MVLHQAEACPTSSFKGEPQLVSLKASPRARMSVPQAPAQARPAQACVLESPSYLDGLGKPVTLAFRGICPSCQYSSVRSVCKSARSLKEGPSGTCKAVALKSKVKARYRKDVLPTEAPLVCAEAIGSKIKGCDTVVKGVENKKEGLKSKNMTAN